MQFTPKRKRSLAAFRYNPYASGGRAYLGQYKQNIEKFSNSTPRKKVFKPGTPIACKRSLTTKLKDSAILTDEKILLQFGDNNCKEVQDTEDLANPLTEEEEDPLQIFPLLKPKETYSVARLKKSPLLTSKDDTYIIPHNEFNKENAISNFSLSTAFYRKDVTPKRSSILLDINPDIEKNALQESNTSNISKPVLKEYKFKRIDKENAEAEPESPHMIGFPNYGNTCYLNSVMQSLMGLHSFIIDLSNIQNMMNLSANSITMSMFDLISGRQKCSGADVKKSLRFLKENMERVDEAFAGFKMQDANEFLTQVLDSVKDEIDQYIYSNSPLKTNINTPIKVNGDWSKDDFGTEVIPHSIFSMSSDESVNLDNVDLTILPMSDISNQQSTLVNPVIQNFGFELLETYKCLGCAEIVQRTQEYLALYVNLPKEEDALNIQKAVEAYMSEDEREVTCEKCGYNTSSVITRFTRLPRILILQLKRYEYNHEQFECSKISAKVDLNMWLYLGNLTATAVDTAPPWTPQSLVISNDSKTNEVETPDESICTVTQIDEIKIDSMTVNSPTSVLSSHEQDAIPELQDIPMTNEELCEKEYEDIQMAIKLSLEASRVCYATDDTSDEASSEEAFSEDDDHAYRLLSVISHFGQTTSTGHYVSDVLNCQESQWYHYDDETVAKLQEAVLLAEGRQKNAYIYFYVDKNLFEELGKTTV